MKIKSILTATLLLVAVSVSAQWKKAGINLSIAQKQGISTLDSAQTTLFNIGLYSAMNKLNGFSVNPLVGVTYNGMNGVQISGLGSANKGTANGVQINGITGINYGGFNGLSVSGLVNISSQQSDGVVISGLANICDYNSGLLLGGLINFSNSDINGVQIAGMANITGKTANGLMVAGLLNLAGSDLNGVQISPLGNIAGNKMNGVQIGIANYATHGKGLQLGLFNYYREDYKGLQLGLINANPETRYQLMIYGGNKSKFNVGVRFKNELFYTILSTGAYYFNLNDKYSATFAYRAGLSLPIFKKLSISGDIGYEHIEGFKNKHKKLPAHLYSLQERINLEYHVMPYFSIFATGGYFVNRYYNKNANYDKGAIIEAGIILF